MSVVTELSPAIAKTILKNASLKGVSVEVYLKTIVESEEDTRINLMREAINDKLFMADMAETMSDFQYTDFEK
jgi:RNase P/RNase MRP subunit p30